MTSLPLRDICAASIDADIREMYTSRFADTIKAVKDAPQTFRKSEARIVRKITSVSKGCDAFELTFLYEKTMERWLDCLVKKEKVSQRARQNRLKCMRQKFGRCIAAGLHSSSSIDAKKRRELYRLALVLHGCSHTNCKLLSWKQIDVMELWLVSFKSKFGDAHT